MIALLILFLKSKVNGHFKNKNFLTLSYNKITFFKLRKRILQVLSVSEFL